MINTITHFFLYHISAGNQNHCFSCIGHTSYTDCVSVCGEGVGGMRVNTEIDLLDNWVSSKMHYKEIKCISSERDIYFIYKFPSVIFQFKNILIVNCLLSVYSKLIQKVILFF